MNSAYEEVKLCDSSKLPYDDDEFDIALSMENLEHLYGDGPINSIQEMRRVAKYLIITTPLPAEVINFKWIYPELVEAVLDPSPLTQRDYLCLESAVHKSTIFPESMINAGFNSESHIHGVYFGKSSAIKINLVENIAIIDDDNREYADYQQKYVTLLAKSANLQSKIAIHPMFKGAPTTSLKEGNWQAFLRKYSFVKRMVVQLIRAIFDNAQKN